MRTQFNTNYTFQVNPLILLIMVQTKKPKGEDEDRRNHRVTISDCPNVNIKNGPSKY